MARKCYFGLCHASWLNNRKCSQSMQHTLVFIKPQTSDNFLNVYMAGSLAIMELERWGQQIWFDLGIVLYGSNDNFVATNENRATEGACSKPSEVRETQPPHECCSPGFGSRDLAAAVPEERDRQRRRETFCVSKHSVSMHTSHTARLISPKKRYL